MCETNYNKEFVTILRRLTAIVEVLATNQALDEWQKLGPATQEEVAKQEKTTVKKMTSRLLRLWIKAVNYREAVLAEQGEALHYADE